MAIETKDDTLKNEGTEKEEELDGEKNAEIDGEVDLEELVCALSEIKEFKKNLKQKLHLKVDNESNTKLSQSLKNLKR